LAISATYITLQRQVADELGNRTDLLTALSDSNLTLSPIQNAIQSAVSKWEREPFYFNEAYTVPWFTTVASQEFYTSSDAASIATTPDVDDLHILISSNRYTLTKRSWQYMEDMSVSPTNTGQPQDWAYFAEEIRLYPIPDGAYPVRASRTTKADALSADSDSNVWTTDAFDLIRSEAKLILAQEVIHDVDLATRMKLAIYGDPGDPRITGYLSALKGETTRRARSRIKATLF
jgi:hypothetical protein